MLLFLLSCVNLECIAWQILKSKLRSRLEVANMFTLRHARFTLALGLRWLAKEQDLYSFQGRINQIVHVYIECQCPMNTRTSVESGKIKNRTLEIGHVPTAEKTFFYQEASVPGFRVILS